MSTQLHIVYSDVSALNLCWIALLYFLILQKLEMLMQHGIVLLLIWKYFGIDTFLWCDL
jgi:hypothetical protein